MEIRGLWEGRTVERTVEALVEVGKEGRRERGSRARRLVVEVMVGDLLLLLLLRGLRRRMRDDWDRDRDLDDRCMGACM